MAADSVEPGAGGLEEIRAKVAAKQSARRKLGWWTAAAQDPGRPWWHALLPPRGWFPAAVGAVIERFRPDPLRAGWFGWLRPAAAVMTGLFVATAASWAVAALPSAFSPSRPISHQTSPGQTHKPRHSASGSPSYTNTTGGGTTPSGQGGQGGQGGGSTGTTPSCSPTPSGTPTTSPSGSPSPTTTPSSSGSPSPTTTPSGTPPPTPTSTGTTPTQNTPTSSPTPGGASSGAALAADWAVVLRPAPANSPEATGKALLSPDVIAATELADSYATGRLSEQHKGAAMGIDEGPVLPTNVPTASPTVSGPASPTPTSGPPPPC